MKFNGAWGYINEKGEIVIETSYKGESNFSNGLAYFVDYNDKFGYIDEKGNVAIQAQFESIGEPFLGFVLGYDFSDDGYAVVKTEDKFGIINKNGKFVIEPKFDGIAGYENITVYEAFEQPENYESTPEIETYEQPENYVSYPANFNEYDDDGVIEVEVDTLINEYKSNSIAAERKYKGKLVKVTGTVEKVEADTYNSGYSVYLDGYYYTKIKCTLKDKDSIDKAADLNPGDTVTIIGVPDHFSLIIMYMTDCVIQ